MRAVKMARNYALSHFYLK